MWFYLVATLKHLPETDQHTLQQKLLDLVTPFSRVIVIKEYGKNGDNPHLNVVLDITQCTFKSMRQTLSRRYEALGKHYYTKNTVKAKCASNKIQAANVIAGYLSKEENREILLNNGIDLEEMENLRETKKFDIKQKHEIVRKSDFLALIYNYYENNYSDKPFDKRLYADMIAEISSNKDLVTGSVILHARNYYFQLDAMLNQGNQIRKFILWQLEEYL
jgi:hypothetical protein